MTQKVIEAQVEIISPNAAQQLDRHEKNIRLYIRSFRKTSAEHFAYVFLLGRELLLAKELIPNGNADPKAGFMKWVKTRFRDVPYRSCTRSMLFARAIQEQSTSLPPLKKRPLQLTNGEPTTKDLDTILKVIPLVMDGKGMLEFMRDFNLLRDPEKQKHHPVKELSAQEAAKAKIKQASRGWAAVRSDLDTWSKAAKLLPAEELQLTIDALVDAANECREALKKAKVETKSK